MQTDEKTLLSHSQSPKKHNTTGHNNEEWDRFVDQHMDAHILQTSAWGQLKSRFGWTATQIRGTQQSSSTQQNSDRQHTADDSQKAGASILFRSMLPSMVPHGLSRVLPIRTQIAYIPKGPLVDWHDQEGTAKFLRDAQAACREHGAALLKIEPDLPDTPANRDLMRSYGFTPSAQNVQPQSTIVLDIGQDEDAIMAQMKSKWRYNIRLAARKEVQVRQCTHADLPAFHQLMQETGARDGFHVHNADYFNAAFDLLVPEHAVYLLAEYEGTPLASIVVCVAGKTAWYLWGASSNRERNRMPNHALQWAAIRWAKARGATRYDLWGIPDEVGQMAREIDPHSKMGVPTAELSLDLQTLPKGELWGVYRLKQGFGGNVVRFVGAWDRPLDPIGYQLYKVGHTIRSRMKNRASTDAA